MSGLIRRITTPFLWCAVMGVPSHSVPDEDPLLQAMLSADLMQRKLLGINQPISASDRSLTDIESLQSVCFDAGKAVADVVRSSMNTKLHSIMYHVADHILDYGCIRKGATDENETLHKQTKKAYSSTNRYILSIAPQLLSARVNLDIRFEDTRFSDQSETYCADEADSASIIGLDGGDEQSFDSETDTGMRSDRIASELIDAIKNCPTIEDAHKAASRMCNIVGSQWNVVKSITFDATFEWWPGKTEKSILYAAEKVFQTKNRKDAIMYMRDGSLQVGIVEAVFHYQGTKGSRVAIVRRLVQAQPEQGNELVVIKFGNHRYKYAFTRTDIVLDVVQKQQIRRLVMLVPDPWVVSREFGKECRMNEVPDTIHISKKMHFFEVSGHKFTSFPESYS